MTKWRTEARFVALCAELSADGPAAIRARAGLLVRALALVELAHALVVLLALGENLGDRVDDQDVGDDVIPRNVIAMRERLADPGSARRRGRGCRPM